MLQGQIFFTSIAWQMGCTQGCCFCTCFLCQTVRWQRCCCTLVATPLVLRYPPLRGGGCTARPQPRPKCRSERFWDGSRLRWDSSPTECVCSARSRPSASPPPQHAEKIGFRLRAERQRHGSWCSGYLGSSSCGRWRSPGARRISC